MKEQRKGCQQRTCADWVKHPNIALNCVAWGKDAPGNCRDYKEIETPELGWTQWECPECQKTQYDAPDTVFSQCQNGHLARLEDYDPRTNTRKASHATRETVHIWQLEMETANIKSYCEDYSRLLNITREHHEPKFRHQCPDWDFATICEFDLEYINCNCGLHKDDEPACEVEL